MTRRTNTDPPASAPEDVRARTLQAMARASSNPHTVWGDEVRAADGPASRDRRRSGRATAGAPKVEPELSDRWPEPSGGRKASPIAIVAGVIALVAVLVGSVVMFTGNEQSTAPPDRLAAAPSTVDRTPAEEPEEVPVLRRVADAAQPVLGPAFTTDEAAEVDVNADPPAGAGCAPSVGGVTPVGSYQRTWNMRDASDNVTANLVIRLSEFADAADVLTDIGAERSLTSLPCAEAALESQMPGTTTELAGPLPIELGDARAAYRLLSRKAGALVMVTDVLIVGSGRLQATVTAARCCEGFGIDNERTLAGSLVAEMARAQDLPVNATTASAAEGPFLSECAHPAKLVTDEDMAAVGLSQARPPQGISHTGQSATSARWKAGAVVVDITTAGPGSPAIPGDLGAPVVGLGDRAGWQPGASGGTLNVRVGEQFFAITVDGLPSGEAQDMAQQLATRALAHLADPDA